VKCAIVIPDVPNYPEDVLEIVAPVNLREKLQLKDGDHVEIEVTLRA
jgi:riboflavin kinase